MKANGSLIHFSKQSKRKSKPNDKKKPEPKSTVIEWTRNGYTSPGKPHPPGPLPRPKPAPGPIQIPPTPDNPPRKPGEKGGVSRAARKAAQRDSAPP